MTDPERLSADLLELAYPYAMDSVTESERRNIENLLGTADSATVAAFATAVGRIHETLALLTVFDTVSPPPELEDTILRALDARSQDNSPEATRPVARHLFGRIPRVRVLVAAATVIIAASVGVAVIVDRDEGPSTDQITAGQVLEQPDVRTHSAEIAGGGSLNVSTSAHLGAATVSFDGVPQPPSGRVYQLWLVPEGRTPRSAGVLEPLPTSGPPLVTRFSTGETLAVTIEPAGGSLQPTTTPIVGVPLT
jgi:anti-sigma-K factor RskA